MKKSTKRGSAPARDSTPARNQRLPSKSTMSESEVIDVSRRILEVFFDYALNKIDQAEGGFERVERDFGPVVRRFVTAGERVEACLPAFPFKSANKVYKVLGPLPDKAEELALDRIQTMCKRVEAIYSPGARVTIISDGITYNDLLCISDQETWAYGEALRTMAVDNGFDCIAFSRFRDLLDFPLPAKMTEIVYVANCVNFRRELLNRYGNPNLDIEKEIATNGDTMLTFLGYKRFLQSDLKHIFPRSAGRSGHAYKRDCKYLAKQMLMRGYAFAGAVKNAYPNHLRLSIHESMGIGAKLSISLLNTKTGFTTPWHCSVAQLADGEWISAPMGDFSENPRLELVKVNGMPSHFKEKAGEMSTGPSLGDSFMRASTMTLSEYMSRATPSASSTGSRTPGISSRSSFLSDRSPSPSLKSSPSIIVTTPGEPEEITKVSSTEESDTSSSVAYGRRLLPQIIDQLAAADPTRTVYSLAALSGSSLSYTHISARAFAQAIDKTAWWLQKLVGKPKSIRPVGYIGPHDLRHVLLTFACVKAGYAALFLSPKNNTEGTLAVLEATKCDIWVSATGSLPITLVRDVLQKRPMKLLQLPLLDDMLNTTTVEPFPYTKTFDEAVNEPFCYLHTSGTTGHPKPIAWSHGLIGTMDAVRLMPPVEGDGGLVPWCSDWRPKDTIYSAFPMSHGAGVLMDILIPALFELRCVLGPVNAIPNVGLIGDLADSTKIDIWSMVPSLADELGETPEILEKLRPSKFICASGGPASPISSGKANEVIRVLNLTGTTEGLFIGNLVPAREDWYWFCFHPSSGFEFKQIDDDTYEHWVHKHDQWSLFQGIFHTFQDKKSINFKDLYMRHPTKPNLWAFKGRSDDLVVLSNGYKISPLETEAYITTHPAVEGCLVFGTGKPQAGLLIELKDPSNSAPSEELVESIWSTVQEANTRSRHKNQLLKNFIIFSQPEKPFLRTDKRTIKRPATLALYADYIEEFYNAQSEQDSNDADEAAEASSSTAPVRSTILKIFRPLLHQENEGKIDPETDLFSLGLDSLGVMSAIKSIRAATGLGDKIAPRHVYSNPTISKLSAAVARLAASTAKPTQDTTVAVTKSVVQSTVDPSTAKLNETIARYKGQQSFRLNPWSYMSGKVYFGIVFFLPLNENTKFQEAYDVLQAGLKRTFEFIPALAGKLIPCSEHEFGYKTGDYCVSVPPPALAARCRDLLKFKDLSGVLPSFAKLREAGFLASDIKAELSDIERMPYFQFPAAVPVFGAQANFVDGGCLLSAEFCHTFLDGMSGFIAMQVWAECCRYVQGDQSATCDWFHPESVNPNLLEIIHMQEGRNKPVEEIDPGTWSWMLAAPHEEDYWEKTKTAPKSVKASWRLPKRPIEDAWYLPPQTPAPAPGDSTEPLKETIFRMRPENMARLLEHVQKEPAIQGRSLSTNDILEAFLWRAMLRARYRVATELKGRRFGKEDKSIIEVPIDGRRWFSELLPESYLGTLLVIRRTSLAIKYLCSPTTSIGKVALRTREDANMISSELVHDVFNLYMNLQDHNQWQPGSARGAHSMSFAVSNSMAIETDNYALGGSVFANGGAPEAVRVPVGRMVGGHRCLFLLPLAKDGAIEFAVGLNAEELKMLMSDKEFTRYAGLKEVVNQK
ncbi:transferase family protein [Astrocystis sublimbata]|nr:transferase family protein [Astrocystis sublimbata]